MFAMVQLRPTAWARFEFGRALDPALHDEALLRRVVHDPERRGDELWDVPMHLAWPILVRFLDEYRYDPRVLQASIRCLGALAWDEPEPAVRPLATNAHEGVRDAAVEALGRMASFASMPSVGDALVDENPDVRRAAVIASGKFGVPALVIAAAQSVRDEPALQPYVLEGAARTKAQVAADSDLVVKALIGSSQWRDLHGWIGMHRRALLDLSRSPKTGDHARARMKAILLVHRVRKVGPEAVEYLRDDALDLDTQMELLVGFGRSRVQHAIGAALPYLRHDDERLQHAAVVALGRIGNPYPWRHLLAQWDARQGRLRDWIRVALRRLAAVDGAEALPELMRASALPPGHAVFIDEHGDTSQQLPRAWLAARLASQVDDARRDAALLLAAFGAPEDLPALQAQGARESDPQVLSALNLGVARLQARGAVGRAFAPWPAVA